MAKSSRSLEDVKWVGIGLSILILLPTLFLPSTLLTAAKIIVDDQPDFGGMAVVAYRTMPLTAAMLVFMLGWLRKWFSPGWPLLIFGTVLLGVSTLLFHPQGFAVAGEAAKESSGGNPFIGFLVKLFLFYYHEYSFWDFFCSLLVGAFGGCGNG
jgi:hypothetical protein